MANTSITFIPPLTNCHLLGLQANLSMYSSVNQAMQMASIISRNGWGSSTPLSFMTLSQKVKIDDEDDHGGDVESDKMVVMMISIVDNDDDWV